MIGTGGTNETQTANEGGTDHSLCKVLPSLLLFYNVIVISLRFQGAIIKKRSWDLHKHLAWHNSRVAASGILITVCKSQKNVNKIKTIGLLFTVILLTYLILIMQFHLMKTNTFKQIKQCVFCIKVQQFFVHRRRNQCNFIHSMKIKYKKYCVSL